MNQALTPREHDVPRLVAYRLVAREIAEGLCMTPNTVRTYAQSVEQALREEAARRHVGTAKKTTCSALILWLLSNR